MEFSGALFVNLFTQQNINNMKKLRMILKTSTALLVALSLSFTLAKAQDKKMVQDVEHAKAEFIKADAFMKTLFDNSYGYLILPNVGKGAIGVGGAAGQGIVYEKGKIVGTAKMKQVSFGFQFGGQAYREVIFFENAEVLDRFKSDKFEFAAQASAVAVKTGASGNVKFRDGTMIFSQEKGGLMYEASVAGQKFDFTAK